MTVGIWSRRAFLGMGSALGISPFAKDASLQPKELEAMRATAQAVAGRTANDVAQDEFYWREIQTAFKLDRTLTNLNNGFTMSVPPRGSGSRVAVHGHHQPAALHVSGNGGAEYSDDPQANGCRVRV